MSNLIPHFSAPEWVQVVSTVGTFAAAIVGWRAARAARISADVAEKQLPELQKQVEIGNQQARAAQEQVELARQTAQDAGRAAREAVRARADERSPRIVVALKEPEKNPYLDPGRSGMPFANELRLLAPESLHRSKRDMTEYYLSEHGNWFLWFRGDGYVINEGPGAARVRIDGEVDIGGTPGVQLEFSGYPLRAGYPIGDAARREYLIAPGTSLHFSWGIGCTIREWAEKHDAPQAAGGEIFTYVWSYGDAGTLDVIRSEFRARPLQPGRGGANHWQLVEDGEYRMGVVTYPAERKWLFEESQ